MYLSHSTYSFKKARLGISVSCAEITPFGSADVLSSGPCQELSLMNSKNMSSPSQSLTAPGNQGVKQRTALQEPIFCPSHLPVLAERADSQHSGLLQGEAKQPSLLSVHEKRHFCTRSLLHAVQEGEVSREPAAWGPQLHTRAHSASFSPVPSLFSHTTAAHKCLFDLH